MWKTRCEPWRSGCGQASSSCSNRQPIRERRKKSSNRSWRRRGFAAVSTFSSPSLRNVRTRATSISARPRIPKVVGGDGPTALASGRGALSIAVRAHGSGVLDADGRGGEADREHLSRRQHRARERAEACLRTHGHRRLGGDRCRQDEALRLHAVLPRPGARRPLHSDRPVLPHLEGARIRRRNPLHRARRRDQHAHAGPCGGTVGQRRSTSISGRASRGPGSCSWAWPTRKTSTTCARAHP